LTKQSRARALRFALAGVALAVGLAFLTTASPLSSQDGPTVSIEGGEVPAGGSEVARLWALDVTDPPLCAFTIDIAYDRLVKVATGCQADPEDKFDMAGCNVDYALHTVRVAGLIASAQGVTGNIPLADITWCALGGVGRTSGLDVQVVNFVDCADEPVEITPVADQDGVNVIVAGSPPVDSDGDGFYDCAEAYMGTDPLDNCPDNSSDAAWPPDMKNDKVVNILDVSLFRGELGGSNPRFDLKIDGIVNILDVSMMRPYLGMQCT
jgi:hypothetical protein